ncbi:heptahelical transmembrane protein 4-like isoform X1 [Camellia sinensis]|uniref:heptahelical transmembrane protein 4-like isoform X1 n=1 Tax=Camellia sinensis TaxID=4442 RepID=UPI001035BB69|nr:heptahelical transmembrane protein 4-like isoform X1 [Camellia sinensis]
MGKEEDQQVSKDSKGVSEVNENQQSKEGKGKRLWNKVKYQLVEYHSLPGYLRDNEFIVGHYRSEWPMKHVLMSIFTIHNETVNVWTHLIGFFLFLALTIYTAMKIPRVVDLYTQQHFPDVLRNADLYKLRAELLACLPSLSNMPDLQRVREELTNSLSAVDLLPSLSTWHIVELLTNCLPERFSHGNHTDVCVLRSVKDDILNMIAPLMLRPITRWPFFAFLGGAMFCLLSSCACHLLACHSERLSYILLRLDYVGIAALISTSFYPPVYYSFMCSPFFYNLYLGFITLLGISTILVSLLPVFQKPKHRNTRTFIFVGMGLSGVAPIMHKLILFQNRPEALHTTGYEILMGVFYCMGAFFYTTRIPERWMPGKFDIAGHSHQLFHVLVVAGAYTHYRAGLVYLRWRDMEGC